MAVSLQVKWIFTMSRTRGHQCSSQNWGLHSHSSTAVAYCLLTNCCSFHQARHGGSLSQAFLLCESNTDLLAREAVTASNISISITIITFIHWPTQFGDKYLLIHYRRWQSSPSCTRLDRSTTQCHVSALSVYFQNFFLSSFFCLDCLHAYACIILHASYLCLFSF